MGLFSSFKNKISESQNVCDNLTKEITEFISHTENLLADNTNYINNADAQAIKKNGNIISNKISQYSPIMFVKKRDYQTKKRELFNLFRSLDRRINEHNNRVAYYQIQAARKVLGKVEGRELDDQQVQCIVKPMRNHLVIAGAGTGKTTTIVGKIKYLLATGQYLPKDILVLSFTNKSAAEMKERISKETGEEIEASTFHKLGLNIITSANGITPKITQINLQKFVKNQLQSNMKDQNYLSLLCKYFLYNHKDDKSEFDFQNENEYKEYLRLNPPKTLKGETVKSYGEMDIANFLYQNGIEYTYEKEYEYDTRTAENFQYYPDFYLNDYGIYLEYFGIDENGNVPAYFSHSAGKNPSEEYREGMEWKRKTHKQNDTTMLECYSYERFQGNLLPNLERKLKSKSVQFNPKSSEELWNDISEKNNNVLTGLIDLITTVINLIKSNGYTIDDVKAIAANNKVLANNTTIIFLIEPIFIAYQTELKNNDEIDFNDMINLSTRLVKEGKYVNPYKCVIVDEYQDISKARYNLLKALRDSKDYSLFCVGDDWQSIYRFTGSDLDYILKFNKYWGETEYSKIETTYRFTESLIEVSGSFVMKNPEQIKKSIKGMQSSQGFALGEIKGYTENAAVKFMLERLDDLPQNSTVFFIGRYNYDVDILDSCKELDCKYNKTTEEIRVFYSKRTDLTMNFLSAHRSKGLQADYAFIINNKDKGLGFPSKIQDDPIVDVLLQGKETFPYAEERRLYYVALTRAKVKTFLMVIDGNESLFASEMEHRYGELFKKDRFICPKCGGSLIKHQGPYGEFYGCSNYRKNGCEFKRKIYSKG